MGQVLSPLINGLLSGTPNMQENGPSKKGSMKLSLHTKNNRIISKPLWAW